MPVLLISGCITGNHRNKLQPLEYIFHIVSGINILASVQYFAIYFLKTTTKYEQKKSNTSALKHGMLGFKMKLSFKELKYADNVFPSEVLIFNIPFS